MANKSSKVGNLTIKMKVAPRGWSYITVFWRPVVTTASIYEEVKRLKRMWWCAFLCKREVTVKEPRNIDHIIIHTYAVPVDITPEAGTQGLTDMGIRECRNCSKRTLWVHNVGFPIPPFLGGGGFKGVGSLVSFTISGITHNLSFNFGDITALPADHTCDGEIRVED